METRDKVLIAVLKEPFAAHTATSLSKALGLTRQGIWKALRKLEDNKLIALEFIGGMKTSTATVKLYWPNPATEKTLSLLMVKESLKQQRWTENFADLKSSVDFLILFGSILSNPKEARDIDLLAVVPRKKFKMAEEAVAKAQLTQLKKIHLIDITAAEFIQELKKPNKAYFDAIKKGVVLFGADSFILCMQGLQK
jgi:hypothetical protein